MGIIAAGKRRVEGRVRIEAEAGDAAVAGFELDQKLRQAVIAGGAADQADVRRFFEDFLAFLLGYASEDGEGLALGIALEMIQAVEDFLFGFIADATGVVEDQLGFFESGDLRIALADEGADDLFGIVRIHLAPERSR